MTNYIKFSESDTFWSEFEVSFKIDDNFRQFMSTKLYKRPYTAVEYTIEDDGVIRIDYPTSFIFFTRRTHYHCVYLGWIMEWIKQIEDKIK